MRHLWWGAATFVAFCFLRQPALAQTAVVATEGSVERANSRTTAIHLVGPGTEINGSVAAAPFGRQLAGGSRATLNTTITHSSDQPFKEIVDGTTYPSVWIAASFDVTTAEFAVFNGVEGSTWLFETPFTLQGTVTGYSDSERTDEVFSVTVACSGVALLDPMEFQSGVWSEVHGTGMLFQCAGPIPSPWTAHDVGPVGVAGVSSLRTDPSRTFNVAGAGSDIWGTSDAFHFVSQPLEGDGELIARVDFEQVTSPFAKAGLMLRQSLAPDAAHVIIDRKPDGGIEFMTRASTGADTTYVAGVPPRFFGFLKLVRSGSTVSGSISTDSTNWTLVGSATLDGPVLAGLAVTSHDDTILNQITYDVVSLTATSGQPSGLPQPWREADIGDTGLPGSALRTTDVFTVKGAGADIWGSADSFHYAYVPMGGSGEAIVTVGALDNTHTYAKAGVMIRASTDPGSAHAILDVKPDGGIEFMARGNKGEETTFLAGATASFPVKLRLQRVAGQSSSLITASVFDSQTNSWRRLDAVTVTMPSDALVGMAVTSHDPERLATATFGVQFVRNLLLKGGFEEYQPPALGEPGWVSDTPFRQVDAVSQSSQPRTGARSGACVTDGNGDCGIYQDVVLPANGSYRLTIFAAADHAGGLVGLNIDGGAVRLESVEPHGFGVYGAYTMDFFALGGRVVRVWMYAPSTPGFVVIDDVSLVQMFP